MARQGYAQFIKAAKSFDGSFAILQQHAPAPVGLFLLNDKQDLVPLPVGGDARTLADILAIAVVNEADDGFKGCLKMETSVFQQTGAKLGASLMLS